MIWLMNFVTTRFLNLGSSWRNRSVDLNLNLVFSTFFLRGFGLTSLTSLPSVLGAALFPPLDSHGVQGSPDDVVAHAGQVAHAAPAHEDDRVLLEVVPHARDVGRDLLPVRETHARDLPQR